MYFLVQAGSRKWAKVVSTGQWWCLMEKADEMVNGVREKGHETRFCFS